MKISQAAVFEPLASRRTPLIRGLTRAGLKVSRALDPEGLRREQLVVVGPGVERAARLAQAIRAARPDAVVLAAQSRRSPAKWADAVLPLPLSPRDLAARLPELAALKARAPASRRSAPAASNGAGILDPLTGFYTFAHFKEVLFIEVKRARRYGIPLSLALVAVDPFPAAPGPELRTQLFGGLALAVRRSLRDTDFPVQYGPDRVLLLMPHTPLQGALVVARRICERVAQARLEFEGQVLRPTLSVGLSASTPGVGELSFADLARQAQHSLDSASRSGGNRVEFFDVADQASAAEAQLEGDGQEPLDL